MKGLLLGIVAAICAAGVCAAVFLTMRPRNPSPAPPPALLASIPADTLRKSAYDFAVNDAEPRIRAWEAGVDLVAMSRVTGHDDPFATTENKGDGRMQTGEIVLRRRGDRYYHYAFIFYILRLAPDSTKDNLRWNVEYREVKPDKDQDEVQVR